MEKCEKLKKKNPDQSNVSKKIQKKYLVATLGAKLKKTLSIVVCI